MATESEKAVVYCGPWNLQESVSIILDAAANFIPNDVRTKFHLIGTTDMHLISYCHERSLRTVQLLN